MTNVKFIGLIILFLMQGCAALHVPQSEILLFEQGLPDRKLKKGFSLSSSIGSKEMRSYAIRTQLRDGVRDRLARRNFFGMSLTQANRIGRNGSLGFAIGTGGIGVDYSHDFSQKIYLTLVGNTARNFALNIQTPVYRKNTSGLGLGVFYRNERHGLLEKCDGYCIGLGIGRHFRMSAFGLRVALYNNDDKSRLRIRFSAGYSPELNGLVIQGGLSAGFPSKRRKRRRPATDY